MYVAISLRKFVQNEDEAKDLVDTVRDKVEEIEGLEIAAQLVNQLCHEVPTPCPQPPT